LLVGWLVGVEFYATTTEVLNMGVWRRAHEKTEVRFEADCRTHEE
jgi:hypothetical protein